MEARTTSSTQFYDALWANVSRVDQHHKCRALAIRKMMRLAMTGNRPRILEPGCGSGIISGLLAEYGEVVGIDQSVVGITNAKKTVRGEFLLGTLPELGLGADRQFDVCVLSQVIEHFHRDEQAQLLRNIHKHIVKGGHIIITTPNKAVSARMRFAPGELQPIETWLTPPDLRRLLDDTGWQPVKTIFAFNFLPIPMTRYSWLRPLRYLLYDVLRLRQAIENATQSWGVGDCTVVLARRM